MPLSIFFLLFHQGAPNLGEQREGLHQRRQPGDAGLRRIAPRQAKASHGENLDVNIIWSVSFPMKPHVRLLVCRPVFHNFLNRHESLVHFDASMENFLLSVSFAPFISALLFIIHPSIFNTPSL